MDHSMSTSPLARCLLPVFLCFIPTTATNGQAPRGQIIVLRAARLIDVARVLRRCSPQ